MMYDIPRDHGAPAPAHHDHDHGRVTCDVCGGDKFEVCPVLEDGGWLDLLLCDDCGQPAPAKVASRLPDEVTCPRCRGRARKAGGFGEMVAGQPVETVATYVCPCGAELIGDRGRA